MNDEQIVAYYRAKRGNPYLTLRTARALEAQDKKNGTFPPVPEHSE
jgi:hypothetical protein